MMHERRLGRRDRGAVALVLAIVSWGGLHQGGVAQEPVLSAEQVLSEYERSVAALVERVAFKSTTRIDYSGDWNWVVQARSVVAKVRVRRNGLFFDSHLERDSVFDNPNRSPLLEIRAIVTDEMAMFYERDGSDAVPIRLSVETTEEGLALGRRVNDQVFLGGALLDSKMPGDDMVRIPDVMRGGSSLELLDRFEDIDGHPCYVLRSESKYGTHTVWIDPKYGYHPRRIEVQKTIGDYWSHLQLSEEGEIRVGPNTTVPIAPILAATVTVDSITIEEIDGVFVPMSANSRTSRSYSTGQEIVEVGSTRREDYDQNPDFAAMRAFEMDVPNGTKVSLSGDVPTKGLRYQWADGKIVPGADPAEVAKIVDEILRFKEENAIGRATGLDSAPQGGGSLLQADAGVGSAESASPGPRGTSSPWLWLGIAGLLAVFGIGIYIYSSR